MNQQLDRLSEECKESRLRAIEAVWMSAGGNASFLEDMALGEFIRSCVLNNIEFTIKYNGRED